MQWLTIPEINIIALTYTDQGLYDDIGVGYGTFSHIQCNSVTFVRCVDGKVSYTCFYANINRYFFSRKWIHFCGSLAPICCSKWLVSCAQWPERGDHNAWVSKQAGRRLVWRRGGRINISVSVDGLMKTILVSKQDIWQNKQQQQK